MKNFSFVLAFFVFVFSGCASTPVTPRGDLSRSLEVNPMTLQPEWREPVRMTPEEDARVRTQLTVNSQAFTQDDHIFHFKIYRTPDLQRDQTAIAEVYEIQSRDGAVRRMQRIDFESSFRGAVPKDKPKVD